MELTLDQALQKGIEAHKAGKAQEADQYYTAILKANPKHPDANHNMGVLAVGIGKMETALPFFKTAVEANPNIDQYWLSYIDALIKLDRMSDAKEVFEQAKSKGKTGESFDQLSKRLGKPTFTNSNLQELSQEEIHLIINLYNQGEYELVLTKARQLLLKFPNSATLYNIIGSANQGLGKLEEAVKAYNKALSIKPYFAEACNNLGIAYKEQGKLEAAINAYNKTLSIKPDFAEAYYNMGIALKEQGKLGAAIKTYMKVISIKPDFAEAYNNLGIALKDQGKSAEAVKVYKKALLVKPNFAETYYNMGNALKDQGQLAEAVKVYNKALSVKPDYAEACNNIGVILQDLGTLEDALEAFNKALSIKPDYADAWGNGADALEKWNKIDQLELWLNKAFNSFEIVPADLRFMKSKLLWRSKNFSETSKLLSDIKLETISEIRRQDYLNLKAKCFEKSNNFQEAYQCFAKSNSLAKKSNEYLSFDPNDYFKKMQDRLAKLKSNLHKPSKANITKNADFEMIFLVGFPRSGTTLLDTILRSHSKIKIVEEKGMLLAAERNLNKNGHYDSAEKIVSKNICKEAKQIYLNEFSKHIKTNLNDFVCIDKLPLNLLEAPLIHQLFPNAKFILALRHPMDTILSCWMQNFKFNSAMVNMVDLDRIVDFYCIAMEIFRTCRANYSLNVHEIRYEDLTNNFQKESEAVVQFLNLEWEPEMEDYQASALKRGRVNTPSYSQVVQPIYKDAQYRWLNYRKYLEQYLPEIRPWILEFGYD